MAASAEPLRPSSRPTRRLFWPDRQSVWRWHFYAGLFCIPFVVWLALTGTIYLFKPQVEAWIDRPYDKLALKGSAAAPSAEVAAALQAIPGSTLVAYEMPGAPTDAARVIVGLHGDSIRVYVHPETLRVLKTVREEARFERVVFKLHGQLLLGNPGSVLVELAASWAIVMIVTGLYLWWPRQARLAGTLYPRLSAGQRTFWRDLHAVTGLWISGLVLFLLVSGLPWSFVWGNALRLERQFANPAPVQQDWTIGNAAALSVQGGPTHAASSADVPASPETANAASGDASDLMNASSGSMPGMDMGPAPQVGGPQSIASKGGSRPLSYPALDQVVAAIGSLGLAAPVLVTPPAPGLATWKVRSDAQDRVSRTTMTVDPAIGAITHRENFGDHPVIDRVVGIGVAAHEGQLFGLPNQLLGLAATSGLVLVSVSAAVLWWRRRPVGVLGAPQALRFSGVPALLPLGLAGLGIALPMLGISMIAVGVAERLVLRRIPAMQRWFGLDAEQRLT